MCLCAACIGFSLRSRRCAGYWCRTYARFLQCYGFLFLLVTRRGPRTGSPQITVSRGTLGSGRCTLHPVRDEERRCRAERRMATCDHRRAYTQNVQVMQMSGREERLQRSVDIILSVRTGDVRERLCVCTFCLVLGLYRFSSSRCVISSVRNWMHHTHHRFNRKG